jgi:serine/threonine protein kinase
VAVDNAASERGGETARLGSFEIVRKLARGGMAEIFLARTRGPSGFEKLVVLKKILPKHAGKPRFVQLFLEEAKLAASLNHPNIAQVYDIGMIDGSYFFTMEYLHGQDVRSILQRTWRTGGRFPIEHAVQIARDVASALHFAHEKQRSDGALLGLVHRDVSPSNIIVTYDGATKLVDFGVAKTAASTVKTRTGTLKGKVAYMSPEQARGAQLDRRSDIFSLGIVLWEMVTTQRLYRSDNDLATLQMIIHQPARPPTSVRPDCPPELERIIMRALADDLDARYATAEQLVLDLEELARELRLKQSSSALAATMSQLFGAELAAWPDVPTAGMPLVDAGEMTTPVSESDVVELEDALDDEGDDELDHVEDDNEKTEFAAMIIDPAEGAPNLGSEASEPVPRDERDSSMLRSGEVGVPTQRPSDLDVPIERPSDLDIPTERPSDFVVPEPTVADGQALPSEPDVPAARVATPSRPFAAVGAPVSAPDVPLAAMTGAGTLSSTPFAMPPWQAGRPASQVSEERLEPLARSWAVVELPPFDPDAFERRRRIVLRVALGVVGFIFLLAIIAGRC